jgi:DNA segregation ATPase FtsK/SpoIIIE-like protein
LAQIVERERDTGIHPIFGTNRPEAAALLVKTNLATRICFAVPSWNASQMVLNMNGAEALPKIQGRGLIVFGARVTEFQSFMISYPKPSDAALEIMQDQMDLFDQGQIPRLQDDLVEKARELKGNGLSLTAIVKELFGSAGGAAFYERSRLVREALG